ncbi:MAG TPA: radical SAM family RiPP maturation amino acid epimerase [Streptosporangiaceae bacterium]|jgi:radical SAM family RiPP maturation amino acid epimerase
MTTTQSGQLYSLLGDLSGVPADYIHEVAHMKRFLERWTMDPKFQERFASDAPAALAELGIDLTPEEVTPLVDPDEARKVTDLVLAGRRDECPPVVLRYRYFIQEKIAHRSRLRSETVPADPRMRAWRDRMIKRCVGSLGKERADAIVHAPAAFELSKGCTVGCWFCGVAAPKFEHTWPHTEENATLWKESLAVVAEVFGPSIKHGFLYWATDPLDNPDYEHFLADFHEVLGECPQTTTAQGQKDIERSRRILRQAHAMGSAVDRFSIIALNSLYRVHEGFTAEELLRVELVPQNKESATGRSRSLKSNAGRARKFARKRGGELVSEEESSTIACVSGFLFNLVDKSVKLITPCNASDRWPLGYWVLAEGTFSSADELRDLLTSMIDEKVRESLSILDTVRIKQDAQIVVDEDDMLRVVSPGMGLDFGKQPQAKELAGVLAAGVNTVEQVALYRKHKSGIAPAETLAILDRLFINGFFDEEPTPPAVPAGEPLQLTAAVAR